MNKKFVYQVGNNKKILIFCCGQRHICNKIVPLAAHPATVKNGGYVVTVPRILDLVTRH